MITDEFQRKKEKRIKMVLNYLKIDEPYEEDVNFDLFFEGIEFGTEYIRNLYRLAKLVEDRQHDIFLKTGTMVSLEDITKKAILEGLRECRV